jgi:hypothetical protein
MGADENPYTGAVLSAYERRALNEIQEWRDEKEGTLKKALDAAGLPVEKLYGLLPDAGRKTLERAVLGAMEMLRDASRWSYPDAGIVREARKLGMEVDDHRDLRFHDLADLDRLARRHFGTNKIIAALEGAGCGMGGIALVAAAIPALFGVSFRAVQQIGSCYGFDMEDPEMAPVVMSVFNVGSSASGAAKAAALADMQLAAKTLAVNWTYEKVAKSSATGAVARLLKESTKHLPREIAQNITKRKLAQTIPVVGAAVGAGFNYWFMSNTTRGAYMLFRHMHLIRKYPDFGASIMVDGIGPDSPADASTSGK